MSDHDDSEDAKRIKDAVHALSEYYDTVQIFATRHESGKENGTVHWQYGVGNFYARYGYVRGWLLMQDEIEKGKSE